MQKKSPEVYLIISIVLAYKNIQYKVPIHILISHDGSHKSPLQMGSCLFALPSTKGRKKMQSVLPNCQKLSFPVSRENKWLTPLCR